MPPRTRPCPSSHLVAGVQHQTGAILHRGLVHGGGEAVVDIEDQVMFFCETARGLEVDDIEPGISGRLQIDHFCVGPYGRLPLSRVGSVDIAVFDPVFRKVLGDDRMGAAENGIAGNEMVAFFEKAHEGSEYGAHARCGGEACLGPFEGAHPVDEFLDGRIAEPAIDIIIRFVGECGAHLFCVVEGETAGQEKGGGMFPFAGLLGPDTDRPGDGALVEIL